MWDEFSDRQIFAKSPVSEVDSQFSGLLFIMSILSKNFSWAQVSKSYMQRSQGLKHKGLQGSAPSHLLASSLRDNYSHAYTKAALLQDFNEDEIQAHSLMPWGLVMHFSCGHVYAAQHCTLQQHLQKPGII